MKRVRCLGMVVCCGVAAQAAEQIEAAGSAYDAVIAPFFRARCVECHGEQKQKATLALHSWEMLARGSDAGPVFVPGKPDESVLVQRLRLPASDEEHMPPEDHAQPSAEEIQLVEHWIARGASPRGTLAELQLPPSLETAVATLPATWAALARSPAPVEQRWEFDPVAVAGARAPLEKAVSALQRRFPGALSYESRTSAALRFTAVGFGREFSDDELALVAQIAPQLVSLDLSGTAVTDRSAEWLAKFAKLRTLRAAYTEVGDSTAQVVASLPQLESLVLSATRVTPACIAPLSRMRTLRMLRLADTPAQAGAQAANLPVVPSAGELLDGSSLLEIPPTPKNP